MTGLLAVAARRFYLRHPWQLGLAVTGIALGVAVYVGVDLANDSARRAFELSTNLITGRATHHLMPVGGSLPDSRYRELRVRYGPLRAAPVLETEVSLARSPAESLTLLGVDPLEEQAFRGFSGFVPGRGTDMGRLMVEPNSVLVPESLARELSLQVGSSLELLLDGSTQTVHVAGTIRESAADAQTRSTPLVADIATAQELLRSSSISRVDLVLTETEAERLRSLDLPGVTLVSAEGRNAAFDELARAFRINLTALSLLALLVGVFLIYATVSFAVVQRRATFGILRAIGVSRLQLLLGILIEALAIGALATGLGLVLGHELARGLVELVLRTAGDFYFSSTVSAAAPSALVYWKALALGVGTTLLAASAPALDAAATSPQTAMSRAALERSARTLTGKAAWAALPAALTAGVLLSLSTRSLVVAFTGLFFIIVAGALLVPAGTRLLARTLEPLAALGFGIVGSLAARGVSVQLSRTGVATAALSVAVATVVGIGLMIGSFRVSVSQWLAETLTADVYLTAEPDTVLDDRALQTIESIPGVEGVSVTRFVRVPTADGTVSLRAHRPGPQGWGLTLTQEFSAGAVSAMEKGEGVLVSEPMAFRRDLGPGDMLMLPTPRGEETFSVLGIFRDYNTNAGTVLLPLWLYRAGWQDTIVDGIGIHLHGGADRSATLAAIEHVLFAADEVRMRSNDVIRERSLAVFDQTFRITEVLRILAGLVAFLGLASALMSIELERSREVAILRAVGLRPSQIRALALTQTGILGLAAGLFAMPLGIIMAAFLILVINVRSFGWSMELVVSPRPLVLGLVLALAAAILAGIYPATRAIGSSVAARLRDE